MSACNAAVPVIVDKKMEEQVLSTDLGEIVSLEVSISVNPLGRSPVYGASWNAASVLPNLSRYELETYKPTVVFTGE